MRFCGRLFSQDELTAIRSLIAANPQATRAALSRIVCEYLNWRRIDGRLKDMTCRVAMLRMQDHNLIRLPAPRNTNINGKAHLYVTKQIPEFNPPLCIPAHAFGDLRIEPVQNKKHSLLWNEYVQKFHYLGHAPMPGDQIRYFVHWLDQVAALLCFRSAVWKTAPRDQFIGWNYEQRKKNLHLVVNNARFLILPWVDAPNLASRILSMTQKRIAHDWMHCYQYAPVLIETFVETPRFPGTCYKAANWTWLGTTKGVGRLGNSHKPTLPQKNIWVYPLKKRFRQILCSNVQ